MSLAYRNLDESTRGFMLPELLADIENKKLYLGSYLNELGVESWAKLLEEAIVSHDDQWLANEIIARGLLKTHTQRSLQQHISGSVLDIDYDD